MKIEYDSKYDLMNIEFLPGEPIVDSQEINGIIIDYGRDGKIVSIEILDASERTQKDPLKTLDLSIIRACRIKALEFFRPGAIFLY